MSDRTASRAAYILPIRLQEASLCEELAAYLQTLRGVDIFVVDGSESKLFEMLDARLGFGIAHVAPSPRIRGANAKARGVLTGLALTSHEKIVVADDDVRYDARTLETVLALLDEAEVVRPQNFFCPRPWHAVIDASRSLIARAFDGDWPGTLAFRSSYLPTGYDADVLFENFELVKTIRARGGRERVARDVFIRRLPPTAKHFWSQRVRQAYDEFARPVRMGIALSILPLLASLCVVRAWTAILALVAASIGLAGFGWLRDGARPYFSFASVAAAPVWVLERGTCAWLAVYERLRHGGVRYGATVIARAAS